MRLRTPRSIALLSLALLILAALLLCAVPASATTEPRVWGWEAASRSATRTPVQTVRTYVVKSGDTLIKIDRKTDSPGPFTRLAYVNRDKFEHPDLIEVGIKLVIPATNGKKINYTPLAPPEPVWTTTSSSSSYSASSSSYSGGGSGNGNCGGNLPPCWVLQKESGGCSDYSTCHNSSSSASGKWQFVDGTWDGYGGYDSAADAPESVQDEKAADLWDGGNGCSHWSAC